MTEMTETTDSEPAPGTCEERPMRDTRSLKQLLAEGRLTHPTVRKTSR
jgi:hypothetical protein